MKGKVVLISLLSILIIFATIACDKENKKAKKKELLIYCGITMIKPMMEIKKIIEVEEDCKIIITKGGSGNLYKSLKINKIGDLYFPGSESYIKKCIKEDLVSDTVFVGYNRMAILVQKGNPKKISSDLNNLKRKDLFVVMGNPKSGSCGKEAKKILSKKGIYEEVLDNTRYLATDTKGTIQSLKSKEADIVLSWFASSVWEENRGKVTVIKIDEQYAQRKKLVIGLLKTSKHKKIAKKFMDLAVSERGKKIFEKYGLGE